MAQWSHTDLSQAANGPTAASQFFGDLPRPMGCVRSDGTNAVVFTGSDNHIHQLHLSGTTWIHTDLSTLASAPDIQPLTSPTSCMRPDGVFSVAYTGRDDHVHILQISGATGSHVDATALAQGAPKALPVGPPTHFVRGDGVAVVV